MYGTVHFLGGCADGESRYAEIRPVVAVRERPKLQPFISRLSEDRTVRQDYYEVVPIMRDGALTGEYEGLWTERKR